jgi:hypothetical protein
MGTAHTAVTSMISEVPTQAARMPAFAARREAKLVKKSQPKRAEPSRTRSMNKIARMARQPSITLRPKMTKI